MPNNNPTPELLQQAMQREIGLRGETLPAPEALEVMRYGGFVGSVIECHEQLERAMERSRSLISEVEELGGSVASGTVILADSMNRTKGRFSRVWHAPEGGVWGCLVHVNTLLDHSRAFVPLAVGIACCEAVQESGGDGATLRWVNDVLFGEKKVAGFLVEGFTGPGYGEVYNLIGFGINVNNTSFPEELNGLATALCQEVKVEVDLTSFTTRFLAKLAWNMGLIYYEEARELREEGFSGRDGAHLLLQRWRELADSVGKRVVYGFDVMTNPQYRGEVLALEPDGGLRIQLEDGHDIVEHSGEIRYL